MFPMCILKGLPGRNGKDGFHGRPGQKVCKNQICFILKCGNSLGEVKHRFGVTVRTHPELLY